MVKVDLESMYCYLWVNYSHVLVEPNEAIVVLFKELDEYKAEFGAEACSNLDLVVRVIGMNVDTVKFIYAWLVWLWILS